MPHKRLHAAQSADHRLSRHAGTGTDPHAPAAQPAIFLVTNSPIPAHLSYPSPAPTPKPGSPHAFLPRRHRPTRPSHPSPLSSPLTSSPIPAWLSSPTSLPKQSPAHPTLSRHTGADPHAPAIQPAILAAHQFPHSRIFLPHSPADPYKNPGSRPPPGFFVISGSVRSPSQQRLR